MKVQGHILDGGFELLILGGTYIQGRAQDSEDGYSKY